MTLEKLFARGCGAFSATSRTVILLYGPRISESYQLWRCSARKPQEAVENLPNSVAAASRDPASRAGSTAIIHADTVCALSGALGAPDTELGVDANGVYGTTYGISTDADSAGGGGKGGAHGLAAGTYGAGPA